MRAYRGLMIAIAAVAGLFMATPAFAQGVGVGALGGITMTSAKTDGDGGIEISTKNGTGYMLGIWFGGNRGGRVGVMGEFSWVVKKTSFIDFGDEITQELSYVEIPVLLRINTGSLNREKPSFYLLLGPVFDIQVKSAVELDGLSVDSPDDAYKGLDIGFLGGAGFEVARFGIEGRYSWGLKSVLATDAAIESGFGKTKLNTFQIIAKIRFN